MGEKKTDKQFFVYSKKYNCCSAILVTQVKNSWKFEFSITTINKKHLTKNKILFFEIL